jgi:2-C-methyl-D-erythritol 2,4-cyclodiphosphate synthase
VIAAKRTLDVHKIAHIAITLEGKRPRMQNSLKKMRENVAALLQIDISAVGITCTSGNNLDDCGMAIGIKSICIITII